ncbi:hypothetical protein Pmani_002814 [Petrolisthes manimaculis]|uniref:Uncharacterized protein n=1 Tax=Petrolisthes manimaculis TaxID=1843537 RepID=A0AAE1QHK4_9EUCA|nr:hypothetical protein Pmani_002814 [Petrolisthes manimaculis]
MRKNVNSAAIRKVLLGWLVVGWGSPCLDRARALGYLSHVAHPSGHSISRDRPLLWESLYSPSLYPPLPQHTHKQTENHVESQERLHDQRMSWNCPRIKYKSIESIRLGEKRPPSTTTTTTNVSGSGATAAVRTPTKQFRLCCVIRAAFQIPPQDRLVCNILSNLNDLIGLCKPFKNRLVPTHTLAALYRKSLCPTVRGLDRETYVQAEEQTERQSRTHTRMKTDKHES